MVLSKKEPLTAQHKFLTLTLACLCQPVDSAAEATLVTMATLALLLIRWWWVDQIWFLHSSSRCWPGSGHIFRTSLVTSLLCVSALFPILKDFHQLMASTATILWPLSIRMLLLLLPLWRVRVRVNPFTLTINPKPTAYRRVVTMFTTVCFVHPISSSRQTFELKPTAQFRPLLGNNNSLK